MQGRQDDITYTYYKRPSSTSRQLKQSLHRINIEVYNIVLTNLSAASTNTAVKDFTSSSLGVC